MTTCTVERMADDVAEMCALLGIDDPIVFGHSAGGFVALHLAVRHPGLAGGLILCNTAPTLEPLPDDNPPPSLAVRSCAEAVEVAARLFGGDFSPGPSTPSPGWSRPITRVRSTRRSPATSCRSAASPTTSQATSSGCSPLSTTCAHICDTSPFRPS